ncbi:MAG: hypothetical protein IPI19_09520 [Ignavibacteriales bacterium]|nr:hypothetical protein [Ignavibacteriales bacterium]
MELIKPERPKRELTQFTVTVDEDWKRELYESAHKLDMSFRTNKSHSIHIHKEERTRNRGIKK